MKLIVVSNYFPYLHWKIKSSKKLKFKIKLGSNWKKKKKLESDFACMQMNQPCCNNIWNTVFLFFQVTVAGADLQ